MALTWCSTNRRADDAGGPGGDLGVGARRGQAYVEELVGLPDLVVLDLHGDEDRPWTDINLTHPVFVGDTIYAESRCTAMRESGSRAGMGIITMDTRGLNQDGQVIVTWTRSVMIPLRESGIGQNYFPQASSESPSS